MSPNKRGPFSPAFPFVAQGAPFFRVVADTSPSSPPTAPRSVGTVPPPGPRPGLPPPGRRPLPLAVTTPQPGLPNGTPVLPGHTVAAHSVSPPFPPQFELEKPNSGPSNSPSSEWKTQLSGCGTASKVPPRNGVLTVSLPPPFPRVGSGPPVRLPENRTLVEFYQKRNSVSFLKTLPPPRRVGGVCPYTKKVSNSSSLERGAFGFLRYTSFPRFPRKDRVSQSRSIIGSVRDQSNRLDVIINHFIS